MKCGQFLKYIGNHEGTLPNFKDNVCESPSQNLFLFLQIALDRENESVLLTCPALTSFLSKQENPNDSQPQFFSFQGFLQWIDKSEATEN